MESVIFQKTVIEAKYEYWIVHFMNGLLNQQTKSFSVSDFISSSATGTFDLV